MRKTASSRQRRTLRGVTLWCRKNRHQPTHEQHRQLGQKLQGHYAYYGIIGNSRSIASVRHKVLHTWHKWLSRRSRGKAQMTWARYISMLNGNFNLPPARIVHSDRVAKPQIRGTGCPKGALGGENHPAPRVINTDEHAGYPPAVVRLKSAGALVENCRHRPVQYLNNVLEQDHRAIKRRVRATQHFRSFWGA